VVGFVLDRRRDEARSSLASVPGRPEEFNPRYTSIHGSWLNQAEIEISLFSQQCF
jgi:hypothetical protein